MPEEFEVGDKVKFKKSHPCGGDVWEVLRVGMDFKLKCEKCERIIMLPRSKFEKSFKKKL
ncbi:DUF951 domain-containing protein [Halanaerobium sp. Z-7514]|uniref:DUF951 domain-containing protein n=1 Tax=Halanaerobium polyolivorans TaxID=2886943 RepID=A0AAW4WZ88_9FIRM|nr:DUF951 domain-containing protein [Halanaerobium polyolivorans]MCC3144709.1 DUF951 domain-containing protein [Halanaerobium polyolivorans]RQD74194.1 MAG: DUF951 domain-containing protein [Halanaerobium sp. MSAO_Bac5]